MVFILIYLFSSSANAHNTQTRDVSTLNPLLSQAQIIKVHFDNLSDAMKLAAAFEPMQSRYELGYMLFYLDAQEFTSFFEALELLNLNAELVETITSDFEKKFLENTNLETIPDFPCYRTVEETLASAEDIASSHQSLATLIDIGDSFEKTDGDDDGDPGYDIVSLVLTNSEITGNKPAIILSGSVHPREYTTSEMVMRFAEFLVENYNQDPDITWILDYHEVHIIPTVNPDGRKIAEQQILRRKNLNSNFCPEQPNRGTGIDLNRNFPFAFGDLGGSSGTACSETFRGPFALSEPEAEALMNYLRNVFMDQRAETGPEDYTTPPLRNASGVFLDVHSSGQLMLYPFGRQSPPPGNPGVVTFARKYGFLADHYPQSSSTFGGANGTTKDAVYGELGVASYTVELGTEFFEECEVAENLVFAKNMQALVYSAKVARTPYITSAGPDILNLNIEHGFSINSAVPPGTDITVRAIVDDSRYNNTNGEEPTQNISRAEFSINTPPWLIERTLERMDADDGSFDSEIEKVNGVIETSGLVDGRHTLYVRASDENGDFGAVTALYFYIDSEAKVPSVVFTDSFETDKEWEVNPNNTDSAVDGVWQRGMPESTANTVNNASGPKQLGFVAEGDFAFVTGLNGGGISENDVDGGTTSLRSPAVAIPNSGANLSLSYYLAHTNTAGLEDNLRITVQGENSSKVITEEFGQINDDDAEYTRLNVNLNEFGGETIRILVEVTDNISNGSTTLEAAIDDIRIISSSESSLPTPEPTPAPTVTSTPIATPTPAPMPTSTLRPNLPIEAENGIISGFSSVYSDPTASGGRGVSLQNFIRSSLILEGLPQADSFTVRYAAFSSGQISIRINQREIPDVSFSGTGNDRNNYGEFKVEEFIPENSDIEIFTDGNDASISVDYIVVGTLASPTPEPTPSITITPMPTPTKTADPTPTSSPITDWYFIVHKPTGFKIQSCSQINGIPITSRPNSNAGSCVQWKQISVEGFFHLQNRFSGKFMKPDTNENGSAISVQPNSWRGNWTQWKFEERDDGFGHLMNRATGKYIFLPNTSRSNITQQPSSWRGDFTRWKFEAVR